MTIKQFGIVLGVLTSVITLFFGITNIDSRWAKTAEVQAIEEKVINDLGTLQKVLETTQKRLDLKILSDKIDGIQRRQWALEDRYENKMPEDIKKEYRELQIEKDQLKQEQELLSK